MRLLKSDSRKNTSATRSWQANSRRSTKLNTERSRGRRKRSMTSRARMIAVESSNRLVRIGTGGIIRTISFPRTTIKSNIQYYFINPPQMPPKVDPTEVRYSKVSI